MFGSAIFGVLCDFFLVNVQSSTQQIVLYYGCFVFLIILSIVFNFNYPLYIKISEDRIFVQHNILFRRTVLLKDITELQYPVKIAVNKSTAFGYIMKLSNGEILTFTDSWTGLADFTKDWNNKHGKIETKTNHYVNNGRTAHFVPSLLTYFEWPMAWGAFFSGSLAFVKMVDKAGTVVSFLLLLTIIFIAYAFGLYSTSFNITEDGFLITYNYFKKSYNYAIDLSKVEWMGFLKHQVYIKMNDGEVHKVLSMLSDEAISEFKKN